MSGARTASAQRKDGRAAPARFAARARRQRLRRVLAGLASVAGVGVVAAAVWLVGWSDVMTLENVRVEGASGQLADRVVDVSEAPLGTPLVRVETSAMAERVRSLPEIASVDVERSWPRSVTVSVTPRVGLAAVSDGSTWLLIDDAGVLFGDTPTQPADVPVVEVPLTPGAAPTRAAAVSVLAGLPAPLREQVAGVSASSEADVRLELDSGATVLWGTSERTDRKAEVLLALLAQSAGTYDVSAPERPALRP